MEQNRNVATTTSLSGGTLGFITFIVFLILKCTGTWDISWFWVFFPLWLPIAIGVFFLIIALFCLLIAAKIDK